MNEGKAKQVNRERLLREHPNCVYCGRIAETEDHCPPRCFLERRNWPEGYSFAACHACNQETRGDEQALAVLIRGTTRSNGTLQFEEWKRLYNGVRNNNPKILAEWNRTQCRRDVRRTMREAFGPAGDQLRR